MRKGSTLSYFANDHLSGTSVVMNDAGGVVSRVRYYPYGNIWTQETGAPPTDRLFTGQRRYGPKSGIYHYGARFYSADIGRFLSADSIVPEPGNPQSLNRYAYVLDNPIRYSDPTGHAWDDGSKGGCTRHTCDPELGWDDPPRGGSGSGGSAPPAGGVYGEGGGRGGIAFDPWSVVGQPDPYIGCGNACMGLHTTWLYETHWAAVALYRLGPIDDYEWSWEQRRLLLSVGGMGVTEVRPEPGSLGDRLFWETGLAMGLFGGGGVMGPGNQAGRSSVGAAVKFDWKRSGHIFSSNTGHVNPTTAATARRWATLFEGLASNPVNYRPNFPLTADQTKAGVVAFTQTFRNGEQAWVLVRNGFIQNAGINLPGAHR